MQCPFCDECEIRVIDPRLADNGAQVRRCAAALLCLGLLLASPVVAAQSTGEKFTAFVEAFHHAFANHDRDAAVALFYWRGVTPADRTRIMALLDRDLALELLGVRLIAAGGTPECFEVDGVPMRKNLPVAARLLARFAAGDGNPRYSLHDLGLDDGVVYIVLAAPDHGI